MIGCPLSFSLVEQLLVSSWSDCRCSTHDVKPMKRSGTHASMSKPLHQPIYLIEKPRKKSIKGLLIRLSKIIRKTDPGQPIDHLLSNLFLPKTSDIFFLLAVSLSTKTDHTLPGPTWGSRQAAWICQSSLIALKS